jgi:cellulose synthase/poly-beta-1,6-N-acetylglucosamine synthase-like glycosyltransferase
MICSAWVLLFGAATYNVMPLFKESFDYSTTVGILVVTTMLFIGYFWLNGIKDVAYTLFYHLWLKNNVVLPPVKRRKRPPLVVLVYCTYNDFNDQSLLASMQQDYPNFKVVILDDSNNQDYKTRIDAFGLRYGVPVIRRATNEGFKAGNLNNYLDTAEYDFCVILDSDEVIPPNFINRALDYFATNSRVGIVQANHKATRNRNDFMRTFARGVDSHWPVYQTVKDRFGFMSLLGHGAMFSHECYVAAGGFPHVVAEDICYTIEAKRAGYDTVFAPDILCEEEFPINYMAFKKRHGKWTMGNMEFIRKNTRKIFFSRMQWFEKLDIILFTYSLPLTAVFSVYVLINVFVLPLAGYDLVYPLWMLAPTALFLIAPMLNDIVVYWSTMKKRALLSYLVQSTLLFGSMYFTSLIASTKAAFGKAVFTVTPKDSKNVTMREAYRYNLKETIFALVLFGATFAVTRSIFSVLLLAAPALFGAFLTVKHMDPRARVRV